MLVDEMELGGVVAMDDGLVGASSEDGIGIGIGFSSSLTTSDSELSFLKYGRSGGEPEGHDWRFLKMARTEPMLSPSSTKAAPFLLRSNSHSLFSDGEQMLSFSSSTKPDATMMLTSDGTFPCYSHQNSLPSSSANSYLRNAGLSSGSSTVSMNGLLSRVRGPFTPSQWMELEHQALIYKYITANVQIPASLLIPIRRSLNPSGFNPFSAGCFGSSTLGWGSFHLGYSGNGDPEPGRCRRTDGKKWRCSRDAVGDQKYCERHMNRGRHRSRKHVEGQSGHAAKATSAIVSSQSVSAVSGSKSSGSLTTAQQQTKDSSLNLADPCSSQFNRMLTSKENVDDFAKDSHSPSLVSSMNQKAIDSLFLASKQHNPFEEASSRVDFGLFSTESLMNSPRSSEITSFIPTPKLNEQSQPHLLRQFIDDSPKSQSDRSNARPSETEEMQSERTQLSISIPLASLDFSSSTSSPDDKLKLSPLKLSHEYNPIEMGLGVGGGILTEVSQRQASWMPISWETSVGGPLGEALTSTSNAPKDQSKNCSSSSINLLTDCWDSSPRFVSSPTGVLQKTAFGSVSSSTRSSPRPEIYKTHDSTGSLCDDLLGSTLVNLSTIPLL
ncbi:growth-regulating factor 7-like isoform X2 [Typha angustifolia]|uniref:growth-regulating factor 7-like isoform X2 n=1 Tax=Typha angustifolia TaxID=59011 RepID=UPI003C2CC1C6